MGFRELVKIDGELYKSTYQWCRANTIQERFHYANNYLGKLEETAYVDKLLDLGDEQVWEWVVDRMLREDTRLHKGFIILYWLSRFKDYYVPLERYIKFHGLMTEHRAEHFLGYLQRETKERGETLDASKYLVLVGSSKDYEGTPLTFSTVLGDPLPAPPVLESIAYEKLFGY